MSTALNTNGLGKRYGRTWALHDCSLQLPQGRVAALVGPNGAGKTTLLHLAIGLLRPDAGDVQVLGHKPFDNPRLLQEVGFVAQQTPLYPDFTAAELIKMGAKLNRRWDSRLAAERLARLGIAQERPVRQLSGGQRAQVALALALAKRPRLLLLDEPVASLDPLARSYVDTGYAACIDAYGAAKFVPLAQVNGCEQAREAFRNAHGGWEIFGTLLVVLPLLAGLFWGAPVVARETELGTHHLVWTQGVTHRRWALAKFGLIGLAVLIAATAYSVLVTWWAEPLTRTSGGRFTFVVFDLHGVAPIGYTLFAVALGIFAGAATRKVLPAMATTLVGFLAVRALVMFAARPVFLAPKERTFPVATTEIPNPAAGDWLLSHAIVDADGISFNGGYAYCEPSPRCPDEGRYNLHIYQPGGRFWLFQYIETGIYLALAAVLLLVALRLIRRRIT